MGFGDGENSVEGCGVRGAFLHQLCFLSPSSQAQDQRERITGDISPCAHPGGAWAGGHAALRGAGLSPSPGGVEPRVPAAASLLLEVPALLAPWGALLGLLGVGSCPGALSTRCCSSKRARGGCWPGQPLSHHPLAPTRLHAGFCSQFRSWSEFVYWSEASGWLAAPWLGPVSAQPQLQQTATC